MQQFDAIEQAIDRLRQIFPFPGYVGEDAASSIRNIASTIMRRVPPGARILDFGAGPMDKTGALQLLGYRCSAIDDLQDFWHLEDGNQGKIIRFARQTGIDFQLGGPLGYEPDSFDLVMLCDVLEHFHDSPRFLLHELLRVLKPEGYLFILVPHAANIRKRIDLLRGKTNLPDFETFFWSQPFRGHVREYVKDDLLQLSSLMGLEITELKSCHNMLGKLNRPLRPLYLAVTTIFPSWRDTWILMARKPQDWTPKPPLPKEQFYRLFRNPAVMHTLPT